MARVLAASRLPRTASAGRPPAERGTRSWLAGVFVPWTEAVPAGALATTFLFQAANLGAYTYLGALLARRFDFGVSALGAVGIFVGLGSIFGAALAGRIGDRARRAGWSDASRLPLWGLLLAVALLIEGWTANPALAVAVVVLWFVASGAFVTDQQTLLVNALPSARALGSAWNTSSMHAGTAIGVWAIGFAGLEPGLGGLAPAIAGLSVAAACRLAASQRRTRHDAQTDVDAMATHLEASRSRS